MTRMIRGKVIVEKKAEGAPEEVGVPASPEAVHTLPQDLEIGDEKNPLRDGDTFAPPSAPWVGAEKAWRAGIVPPPHEEWSRYEKRIGKKGFLEEDLTLTDVEVATVLSTLPPPSTAHAADKKPASSQLLKYAAVAALTAVTAWAVISASRAAHNNTRFPKTVTPAVAFESAAMLPQRGTPAPQIEEPLISSPLREASNVDESVAVEATPRSKIASSKPSAEKRASVPAKLQDAAVTNPYSENSEPRSVLSSEAAAPEAAAATTPSLEETFNLSNPYVTTGSTEVSPNAEAAPASPDLHTGLQSLTRETVRTVMDGIAPAVIKCGNGMEQGKIVLRVTVSGATGRVRDAEAAYAPYVNTPVGFCAARAVRLAKFPQFSESEITIKYPFEF